PISSQKPAKHDKKDIQDTQNHNLNSHRVCINQISTAKSPSPQRESKPQSRSRRSPHKRNKRDVREKCKSPVYQIDCATSCSSTAGKSPKTTHGSATSSNIINNNNTTSNLNALIEETTGYNSGDEHIGPKDANLSPEEWESRDKEFIKALLNDRGFKIQEIVEDGACLFRSISLQIYGDQDMHQFVTEDINNYVSRKRNNHVHGNHIEIQAMSEIYNRPVELYCYGLEPINIFNSDQMKNGCEPLRLSYQ
ncbi:OTU domain-containing protein 5, partial [Pseudolycoriella hygida]